MNYYKIIDIFIIEEVATLVLENSDVVTDRMLGEFELLPLNADDIPAELFEKYIKEQVLFAEFSTSMLELIIKSNEALYSVWKIEDLKGYFLKAKISNKITIARKRKRLTQQQLADACGVNISTIQNMESNNYETGTIRVLKFLGIL